MVEVHQTRLAMAGEARLALMLLSSARKMDFLEEEDQEAGEVHMDRAHMLHSTMFQNQDLAPWMTVACQDVGLHQGMEGRRDPVITMTAFCQDGEEQIPMEQGEVAPCRHHQRRVIT